MSIKILVQTLTQIPDIQLLQQLTLIIKNQSTIMIPDLTKFYLMFNSLYYPDHKNKPQFIKILSKAIQLNKYVLSLLLVPDIQLFWKTISSTLITLLGQEDQLIRQQAKIIIKSFLISSNNYYIVFQSIFQNGIQLDQQPSISIVIYSIKFLGRILQQFSSLALLTNSLQMVELFKKLFQQLLRIQKKHHLQASKTAKQFLIKIFYMKVQRIQQVLQRLSQPYAIQLQKLWQKQQNNVLKEKQANQQFQSIPNHFIQIKYQHLPVMNGKTFGIFQPFVFKQIFHPDNQSSLKFAIKQLKQFTLNNEQKLIPYINAIYKVTMMLVSCSGTNFNNKFIFSYSVQLLQILQKILQIPGISKLIHLEHCGKILCQQLDNQNVLYRRCLRTNLKKLNLLNPKGLLKIYEQQFKKQDSQWLKTYQLLLVIEHWIQNISDGNLPTLSPIFQQLIGNDKNNQKSKLNKKMIKKYGNIKITQKCNDLVILILQKYPEYRQDLERLIDQQKIGEIQDVLQNRKNGYKIGRDDNFNDGKQADQIFMKQYHQQRKRYLNTKK